MAKVELLGPIASVRGMISKDSEVYFRTQNGKTILCKRPERGPLRKNSQEMSQKQHEQRLRFKKMQEMTRDVMQSAGLRHVYEVQWKRQKKYATLRGYVSAQMYAMLKV